MSKRSVVLLALALAGLAAIAVQTGSAGGGPPHDSITGSGKIAFTDFPSPGETTVEQLEISAHAGPSGEDVRGIHVFRSPFADGPQVADVTCLAVNGNRARVGGEFREVFDYLGFRIRYFLLIVEDRGSDDRSGGFSFIDRPRPPGFSPCNFDGPTDYEVVQGNFVVRDATAAPASRLR